MSHIYNELNDISDSLTKLRESIHKNEIFLKATEKQEETFYNMLNSFIHRTKEYTNSYKEMKHVLELNDFYAKAITFVHQELTFDLDQLKLKLDQFYNDKEENFVASAEMIVLWPLRMMNERMYRNLTNEKRDLRFDNLFNEVDVY